MSLTVDHCGQATEVTESYPIGANEWQSDLVSHEDLLIQDQIPCGLLGFQAEADAMLDLNWTVEIDDYTAARDTERSHCSAFGAIDSPHAGAVDHIALTDPALWEQQVVDPDFHIPIPEYSNAECNMSTSLQDMMGIQQNDSNHTQQLVHTDKPGTFAMPDQHSETTASIIDDLEHSQRPSKRKQLKSLLSRKRRRFTPSGLGRSEAPSTPRTDTSLNNGQSMEPAAEIASLARKRAILGSTSNENLRRTLRTDWVSAWEGRASSRESTFESRHAVRDVNISDVNRRPLSWPRRHALRKSLDISVAVLTKGFENLIKEQGDTSM